MPKVEDSNPQPTPPPAGSPPPKPHGPPPQTVPLPAGSPSPPMPPGTAPGQPPPPRPPEAGPALTGQIAPGTPLADWEHTHREVLTPTESHPQLTTAEVSGPRPGEVPQQKPSHFVILHTGLGGRWRQGDVIPSHLVPEEEHARLLELGALRPADEREREQKKVTLPAAGPAPALEMQLADARKESERLRIENSQLQEQLRVAKGQATAQPPMPATADPKIMQEKDKTIADLQRQLQEAQQKAQSSSPGQQPQQPQQPQQQETPKPAEAAAPQAAEEEDKGFRGRGRR